MDELSYGELLERLRRDGVAELLAGSLRDIDSHSVTAAKAYCSTAQAIGASTHTTLAIDTVSPPIPTAASPYGQFGFMDLANHRYVVPADGFYYVTASASIVCSSTAGTFYVAIRQNGTTTREIGVTRTNGIEVEPVVNDLVYAKRGDFLTVDIFSSAADTINNGATYKNVLSAIKVG